MSIGAVAVLTPGVHHQRRQSADDMLQERRQSCSGAAEMHIPQEVPATAMPYNFYLTAAVCCFNTHRDIRLLNIGGLL